MAPHASTAFRFGPLEARSAGPAAFPARLCVCSPEFPAYSLRSGVAHYWLAAAQETGLLLKWAEDSSVRHVFDAMAMPAARGIAPAADARVLTLLDD